jgi:protein-S-isoprenylcysteine O-methyltransferase Ste14
VKLNLATLAIILMVAGVLIFKAFTVPFTLGSAIGMSIAIPAVVLLIVARLQLGAAFSVKAKASTLVTNGLYSRIRNPIYVFSALLIAGVILWAGKPWFLLIFAILIPLQVVRARNEAKVLEEKFGTTYVAYKQKTWF